MIKKLIEVKGGFSELVVNTSEWKEYVEKRVREDIPIFGYVGAPERTEEIDKVVEGYFIMKGLSPEAIACWVTSTVARHFADQLYDGISRDEVIRLLDEYTSRVYLDLAIWNFPGYKGVVSDFNRIKKEIEKELRAEKAGYSDEKESIQN